MNLNFPFSIKLLVLLLCTNINLVVNAGEMVADRDNAVMKCWYPEIKSPLFSAVNGGEVEYGKALVSNEWRSKHREIQEKNNPDLDILIFPLCTMHDSFFAEFVCKKFEGSPSSDTPLECYPEIEPTKPTTEGRLTFHPDNLSRLDYGSQIGRGTQRNLERPGHQIIQYRVIVQKGGSTYDVTEGATWRLSAGANEFIKLVGDKKGKVLTRYDVPKLVDSSVVVFTVSWTGTDGKPQTISQSVYLGATYNVTGVDSTGLLGGDSTRSFFVNCQHDDTGRSDIPYSGLAFGRAHPSDIHSINTYLVPPWTEKKDIRAVLRFGSKSPYYYKVSLLHPDRLVNGASNSGSALGSSRRASCNVPRSGSTKYDITDTLNSCRGVFNFQSGASTHKEYRGFLEACHDPESISDDTIHKDVHPGENCNW
ncbi:hypothetical protein HWQ46_05100 [Shewanella sp. D64]|uniref:hypothetical protein n=1 Tax=unclassified Shewanella TaxID=196818 RepID=UPI0022BA4B47|nr:MULTISPECIES: hypothetical protein [unclassified Shewanella]MEC4724928.1 hypothetical protein [Shewanella sp. D64]MEC4736279.1 hypothetical protein [Shewanella sp. E94]WBJ97657.1 hypothetical protein HWQ47_11470 [Shewanella sp. MTB7]